MKRIELYSQMLLIRRFEERLFELFENGELDGTIHASLGQESIAVAILNHFSIGDDVQIGTHSYVLPGVTINKGALISTHSIVQEDIPEYTIVAGIPARAVGIRK